MWNENNGKSSRIKSEIKLGYRRKWICANKEETEV